MDTTLLNVYTSHLHLLRLLVLYYMVQFLLCILEVQCIFLPTPSQNLERDPLQTIQL